MREDEMINYGAQIIAQALDKPDVIKFNDICLREMSQIIEDMNKGVMKALYDEGYRKVSDDEIVIKKRQYEQLKKYNRDRKRLRLKWQQAKQETKEILQQAYMYFNADNMLGLPNYLKNERAARVVKGIARSRGIELEDKNNDGK